MRPAPWCRDDRDGVVLTLYIQPGAKQTAFTGLHGEALKIRVAAPAVENQANAALMRWLADRLDCRLREIELLAGANQRNKRVRIDAAAGLDAAAVAARLTESMAPR